MKRSEQPSRSFCGSEAFGLDNPLRKVKAAVVAQRLPATRWNVNLRVSLHRLYTISEPSARAAGNSDDPFPKIRDEAVRAAVSIEMSMIASGGSRSQSRLRLLEGFPSRPRVTREARRRPRSPPDVQTKQELGIRLGSLPHLVKA
jgi:hypothetical protein